MISNEIQLITKHGKAIARLLDTYKQSIKDD